MVKRWQAGDSLTDIANSLNMTPSSLKSSISQHGIKRNGVNQSKKQIQYGVKEEREDPPPITLPEIHIREYVPHTNGEDEETQGTVISDGHAGKITRSFNDDIYKSRMETLFRKIITIKKLHEHMYPINHLRLLYLGDMVQGENPHQGSKVGDISMGARDQVVKLALPTHLEFIYSLKQHYSTIEIDCFPGNHGMIAKEAPQTSNWDLLLYDILKATLSSTKDIKVNIHEDFGGIVDILGWSFFCFHGDGIPSNGGVPLIALSRRVKSWHIQYKGFRYAICGHFHKIQFDEIARGIELFMNSTIVSDDEWALKKMGISSEPAQWTFGVHPQQGVSWHYPLYIAN